jgi:hypothetical protein
MVTTAIFRLSASVLLLTGVPGHAQSAANANRSAEISHARMQSVLRNMGFPFTGETAADSTTFAFHLNGHVVTLVNHVKSMQLSACFEGQFDPMKANQWNREHFSTRADLGAQGCTSLGSNVNFGGGVTDEMIEGFISNFCTNATLFARYLIDAQPADRSTSPIGLMEWSQSGQNTKSAATSSEAADSVPGLLKINRNISLRYDPERWKQTASDNEGPLMLAHSYGDGQALVIVERIAVHRGAVEDVALANAQLADPNAKVIYRAQRRINGSDVRFLKIEANIKEVPMVYWGYFYGGENGTVQVVAYTAKSRLSDYEKDFMDFLAGFTISK